VEPVWLELAEEPPDESLDPAGLLSPPLFSTVFGALVLLDVFL
jgi:hypothetical protein